MRSFLGRVLTEPQSNARLDAAPGHIGITYDSNIAPSGSSMMLLDATGSAVPTAADPTSGNRQTSIHPMTDLAPGPYTVDWTSVSADDGHAAQGFYTFVVNGGPAGIIAGQAQAQSQAADLMATLTVTAGADGSSLLRVDLDNPTGVERVQRRARRYVLQAAGNPRQVQGPDRRGHLQRRARRWRRARVSPGRRDGRFRG